MPNNSAIHTLSQRPESPTPASGTGVNRHDSRAHGQPHKPKSLPHQRHRGCTGRHPGPVVTATARQVAARRHGRNVTTTGRNDTAITAAPVPLRCGEDPTSGRRNWWRGGRRECAGRVRCGSEVFCASRPLGGSRPRRSTTGNRPLAVRDPLTRNGAGWNVEFQPAPRGGLPPLPVMPAAFPY
jgi:hypothetical protein